MSVHFEKGRRELEEFSRNAVDLAVKGPSPRNPFFDPSPDQLLRVAVGLAFRRGRLQHVYSILRGKDLETGDVSNERRTEQFSALAAAQDEVLDLTNWHEFLKCLSFAGFRSRKMVTSETAIIYCYLLWLIGKRDFGLDHKTLRPAIGRWFFMAATTSRYSNSAETQIEADLARIRGLELGDGEAFLNELERVIRSNFTGDYWSISLPNRLDSSSARSPVLFAYWAALNNLDAELLLSDMKIRDLLDPTVTAPRAIERHHLFPRKFLGDKGVSSTQQINAIANMAFLDWPENAEIGADDPREYWPELSGAMPPDRLKKQSYWHALPVGWEQLDYPDFLEKRRNLIAAVVHDGFDSLYSETSDVPDPESTLNDLLSGESQAVEYKSTARWNIRAEMADKKMEHIIVKTVCGFLNAEGGTLLIGVDDDSSAVGLGLDYALMGSKGDRDGYELWLRQHLDNALSMQTAGVVRISFDDLDGEDVCIVSVGASGRPVFSKPVEGSGDHTEFWVRIGNATKQLHGDDMVNYQSDHWD